MTGIFPILILNGRPAAGKSELIHFLQGLPDDERRERFHVGRLHELDDFPMLWTWFEEDHILEHRLGRPRLHTDSDGYFVHNDLWHLLIERLSLEYDRLLRDAPDLHATHTVLIEFSRGSEHGGYRAAYPHLSDAVLKQVAIFFIDVPYEESLRKNRRRFNPDRPDSILEHGLPDAKLERTDVDQMIHTLLYAIGAVLAFVITAHAIDLLRAIVDERPPSRAMIDLGLFEMQMYVFKSALIGAALGGLAAGLAGTQVAFPLGMTAYNTTRTVLNALRSIEPLIMGIVFVIWVGVGPFAGVLALTLHSIASLGKLYSEQVENIDAGPIEAIQSTGANRLQTIVYAVVPQIVPPYIAFTMYRWDINVRMSTIIGFVGGGGIGFLLQQQINLLRYSQAGVAVLAIAIVVSILDYASAAIRERIV